MHDTIPLTEPQRRIISSSLQFVEDQILRCCRILADTSREDGLYVYENHYTREQAAHLLDLLRSLLSLVRSMAEVTMAQKRRQSVQSLIAAALSSTWETIEDLRPRHLKGYGAVDARAAKRLDRFVDEATHRIRNVLDCSHTGNPSQQPTRDDEIPTDALH